VKRKNAAMLQNALSYTLAVVQAKKIGDPNQPGIHPCKVQAAAF